MLLCYGLISLAQCVHFIVTSDSYIPTRTICDCVTMGSPIQIHTTHLESRLIPTITKLALLDSLIPVYPYVIFSLYLVSVVKNPIRVNAGEGSYFILFISLEGRKKSFRCTSIL